MSNPESLIIDTADLYTDPNIFATAGLEYRNNLQAEFISEFLGGDEALSAMSPDQLADILGLMSSVINNNEEVRKLAQDKKYKDAAVLMKQDWDQLNHELAA